MRNKVIIAAFVLIWSVFAASAPAVPLGTAFTYQGQVQLSGGNLNDTADFQFDLWDDAGAGSPPTGGVQIGATQTANSIQVVNGYFTVQVDFGANIFDGNARWLGIAMRSPAGSGNFVSLSPRQPVTASPYALYALHSPGGGLWANQASTTYNTVTGFVGINRSTRVTGNEYFGVQAPISSGYGGMYIGTNGTSGMPFYGYDAGGNTMWTYYDGSSDKWHVYNGGNRLTVTGAGDVGIGTTSPAARLSVVTSSANGVEASSSAAFSYGVMGTGLSAGVRGECSTSDGSGVYGYSTGHGGSGGAVRGDNPSVGGAAIVGYANLGTGVYGQTSSGYGVYASNGGSNTTGYAGYFNGRVHVNGALSKNSGSFMIDHPLDPANKYLSHSFVESPDMMNIYNGIVTTDGTGRATVTLPDYFEVLNQDFRYQLTVIDSDDTDEFVLVKVISGIETNHFSIRSSKPGTVVSWQVTGIRHDAWANAHRIVVEEVKAQADRGKYLTPEVFGLPKDKSIGSN